MFGRDIRGRFIKGSEAARQAGRSGGLQTTKNGHRHKLTKKEQARGGRASHKAL